MVDCMSDLVLPVSLPQGHRINLGSGQIPTAGWLNFDASPSFRLSQAPSLS